MDNVGYFFVTVGAIALSQCKTCARYMLIIIIIIIIIIILEPAGYSFVVCNSVLFDEFVSRI